MRFLVPAALLCTLLLSPAAWAGDDAAGCQGTACSCGQTGEGAKCPLHRPGKGKAERPSFDAHTIATMYGTVTSVERAAPNGVHLKVQVGQQLVTVHLGPAAYLDPKLSFAEKDAVQFTGSNVTWKGQPTVVATLVTRGGTTVRLREDDGTPLFPL